MKVSMKVRRLKVHSDERGWLVEVLRVDKIKKPIKQVYVATIKPGKERGNHYHSKKTEWFFIAEGDADIFLYDLKTKKKKIFKLSSKKPRMIVISPNVVHTVKNSGKKTAFLVSGADNIYDPKKPDTFLYNEKLQKS